jgi:hypothetical protein
MSDLAVLSDDFSPEEKSSLLDYTKNGCPGLVRVTDVDAFKCFELYMAGKTYSEIHEATKVKKDSILYLSNKSKWHEKKMAYYTDINANLANKMLAVKMESLNTIASIATALGKYYGKKMNNYLSTNDDAVIEALDTKLLSQYYKAMEFIESSLNVDTKNNGTNVNINLTGGATVKQVDGNTIEVTDQNSSDILAALAAIKKSKSNQ